jgi:predicted N-acyltransferase
MLRIERYCSISEIEESVWDSIVSPNEVFNTHRFIQVVEKSKVEDASFWYLLFFNGDELIGHSVLSCFTISLDLFIPGSKAARWIKKIFPEFFNVRILFSGLPASFGQLNLRIINDQWNEPITKVLSEEMEKLAASEKVSLLCVKEFKGAEADDCRVLMQQNFFKAFSLPYMELEIKWDTWRDYFLEMRHPYRRAIKVSLKKLAIDEPIIYSPYTIPNFSPKPILVLGDKTLCAPEQMYDLYLSVMGRTPTKLETLNLSFFKHLYNLFGNELKVLTVQHQKKILSAALLIPIGDELTFMLVGRGENKDEYDSYFNLVYGIVSLGIRQKFKKIKMGQTAYWVKQRVGSIPTPVHIYFKSRRPLMNLLLTKLNRLIFPEVDLKPIHLFKDEEIQQKSKVTSDANSYSVSLNRMVMSNMNFPSIEQTEKSIQ